MRLIIIGCEYTGKTTLARAVQQWIKETMGEQLVMVHDHFLPDVGEGAPGRFTAEEESEEFFKLKPFALEKYMRYMIHYHLGDHFYSDNDHIVVDWYYADAVYAPLYFGYGGHGQYADRHRMARHHDMEVAKLAPDTVLVHLTASPEVIRQRMQAAPRSRSRFRDEDIEQVLERYQEEFASTLLRRHFTIDTSATTPDELRAQFLTKMQGHITPADHTRILGYRALKEATAGSVI